MPVIIITGFPASGKTKVANELESFFKSKMKETCLISENNIIRDKKLCKNELYNNSNQEKEVRSIMKSLFTRSMSPETLTIIDGLNYIKGFRYEIFCATKSAKTTQCMIHCQTGKEICWEQNLKKENSEQYSREIFDALVLRYETPDSRNRWDSPLFHLMSDSSLPLEEVFEVLYCRKPLAPNQSTQCPPLSETNFLHELDNLTQEVISAIVSANKLNLEGEIKIPGCEKYFILSNDKNSQLPQLLRMKRQFLTYVKLHPTLYKSKDLKNLFVQYLNTNL